MMIIGITGTIGAGKGTIVDYLVKKNDFQHYSVRNYLRQILKKENKEANRDNLRVLANKLRSEHSPSYITDQLLEIAIKTDKNSVIESLRTMGEIESLRMNEDFYLIAVDAQDQTRYNRIKKRATATDHISFETFLANEKQEMNSEDPNNQNLAACIKMADYKLLNNGNIEELEEKVGRVLGDIEQKEIRRLLRQFDPEV